MNLPMTISQKKKNKKRKAIENHTQFYRVKVKLGKLNTRNNPIYILMRTKNCFVKNRPKGN